MSIAINNKENTDIKKIISSKKQFLWIAMGSMVMFFGGLLSALIIEKADLNTFQNLNLAYVALKRGGNIPCVLNAANEIAVESYLNDKIGFLNMSDLIANCMEKITFVKNPTIDDYIKTNNETRVLAKKLI